VDFHDIYLDENFFNKIYFFFLAPPNFVRLSAFPALVTVLVECLDPVTELVFDPFELAILLFFLIDAYFLLMAFQLTPFLNLKPIFM